MPRQPTLNINRRQSLADVFGAEMASEVWERFTVHYTPTHGSFAAARPAETPTI